MPPDVADLVVHVVLQLEVDEVGVDVLLLEPVAQRVAQDLVLGVLRVHQQNHLRPVELPEDHRDDLPRVTLAVRKPGQGRIASLVDEYPRVANSYQKKKKEVNYTTNSHTTNSPA